MPRFAWLWHAMPQEHARPSHFDLMLQVDGEALLNAWKLGEAPGGLAVGPLTPKPRSTSVMATPLPAHRMLYLDYEGPVSQNRGTVHRIDWGEYAVASGQLMGEQFDLELHGSEGKTVWRFVLAPPTANAMASDQVYWVNCIR